MIKHERSKAQLACLDYEVVCKARGWKNFSSTIRRVSTLQENDAGADGHTSSANEQE